MSSGRFQPLAATFYERPTDEVARELLGRYLVRQEGEERLVLRLVETEAYLGASDRASHAWAGRRTPRNESLYLPGGHAYVYFIYGVHHCLNAVTGECDCGSAVLLRAAEVLEGSEMAQRRRRLQSDQLRPGSLAGGPGKLCQALQIDRRFDGRRLDRGALQLTRGEAVADHCVARGPRIGVGYSGDAAAWLLRFAIAGHPEMSRPRLGRAPRQRSPGRSS